MTEVCAEEIVSHIRSVGSEEATRYIKQLIGTQTFHDFQRQLVSAGDVFSVASKLERLPPQFLHDTLGWNALLWVWLNASFLDSEAHRSEYIQQVYSGNFRTLLLARDATHYCARRSDLDALSAMTYLLECATETLLEDMPVQEILRSSKRELLTRSERLNEYCFSLLRPKTGASGNPAGWNDKVIGGSSYSVFLDGPVGIGLMFMEIPIAVVSFGAESAERLMIYQLQGIRPKRGDVQVGTKGLFYVDFQAALVEGVLFAANKLGFKSIGIRAGKKNPYTRGWEDGTAILSLEKAVKNYDKVAERLGFLQESDENWYRNTKI